MSDDTSRRSTSLPRFIPSLDGLRGLAALAVVWFHFPQVGNSPLAASLQDLSQKTLSGPLAVSIFLVLSGFLITRIILREVREARFTLRLFLAKRALRIFPIYFMTLAVFAASDQISTQWIAAACYVSNYTIPFDTAPHPLGHTWSLAVEEQFYLLWPLAFVCFPLSIARRAAWPLGPAIAVCAAALTFALVETDLAWGLVYRALPTRMLSLLLGAAFAFYEPTMRRWPEVKVGAGGVLCYLLVLGSAYGFQQTHWSGFRLMGYLLGAAASLLAVQFVVLADNRECWTRRMLRSRPLACCGRISYGLYLYHHVILFTLFTPKGVDARDIVLPLPKALIAGALCLGIPLLSYGLIEAPLLRLKSRLPELLRSKRRSESAAAMADGTA